LKKGRICELLDIEYPIIQAPMNRITGAELAAAVSNAGGLGVIGPNPGDKVVTTDVVETGELMRREIRKAKSLTDKPFGVNLVVLEVEKIYSDQCAKVILEEGVTIVVLAGSPPERYLKQLKDAGIKVLYRPLPVNNVEEAKKAEQLGIDAFIAVGFEGGGHVGDDRIPTFVLVPQVVNAVKIPVIAGGGVVDGRGLVAAMVLGAEGVFIGSRFIATNECLAHESYKKAIVDATDISTVAMVGKDVGLIRAFKTPLVDEYVQLEAKGMATAEDHLKLHKYGSLPWLTGDWADGAFPVGAGAGLVKEIKGGADVIKSIVDEAEQILNKMCK
jgi:NAD(P)H-dependent flavin oxidoreductase YrpB (nitropropane dioxygenase family)